MLRAMLSRLTIAALTFAGPAPAASAAPPAEPSAVEASPEPAPEAEPAPDAEPSAEAEREPEPEAERPSGGGVAGSLVDPDDPDAQRAKADLEGESLEPNRAGVPERLTPLGRAGWWSLLGAASLASAGGILAGLAERQEQEARRLALGIDLDIGARYRYGEVDELYEKMNRRGRQFQGAARGLFIAGAVGLAASITFFAVDAKRRRGQRDSARLRFGAGSMELDF